MFPTRTPWWSIGAAMKAVILTGGRKSGMPIDPVNSSSSPTLSDPERAFMYSKSLGPSEVLPQPLRVVGAHARNEVVFHLARFVQGGDEGVSGARHGAGAVQDALQRRLDVEALIDAQAGAAEPGQPVPQRRYLTVSFVRLRQFLSPPVVLPALRGAT